VINTIPGIQPLTEIQFLITCNQNLLPGIKPIYLESSHNEGDDESPNANPDSPGEEVNATRLREGEERLQQRLFMTTTKII